MASAVRMGMRIVRVAGAGAGLAAATLLSTPSRTDRQHAQCSGESSTMKEVEVIVVGGGIIGSACAKSIAENQEKRHGKADVMLIERDSIGSGASGLSAGTMWSGGWGTYKRDGSNLTSADVTPFLCAGTMDMLNDIQADHDIKLRQCGTMTIACTATEAWSLLKSYLGAWYRGLDCELYVGSNQVRSVEPGLSSTPIAAMRSPQGGHCNPMLAACAFAEAAEAAGAEVCEGLSVTQILPCDSSSSSRFEVRTSKGDVFRCAHIVLASGAWFPYVQDGPGIALNVPIAPVKGQMWITEPQEQGVLKHVIYILESDTQWSMPGGSSRDEEAGIPEHCTHNRHGEKVVRHAYGRQTAEGGIAFGGDRQAADPNDYTVNMSGIERHREHVAEFLNESIMSIPVEGTWVGLMPFSMDGESLVGELAAIGLPGLWIVGGFGPHGIMEGPFAAKLLADAVTGDASMPIAVAEKFDPCRKGGISVK